MLTYRLDPLSNPNSPIVCHRTEKTRCMAVRGGKEEPDGGIRRPACERGVDVMGYSCLPSCPGEGKMLGRGTLCTLSLSPTPGQGGRFPTPIYGRQRYIFFRFLPNLSPLFCILAGNFNWFASFSNLVCPISLHKIIFAIDNLCFAR